MKLPSRIVLAVGTALALLVGGLSELVALQGWRLRDRLPGGPHG